MCTRIVIHQNEIFTNSTCICANVNIQDLVYVPESRQRAVVNDVEVRFPLSTYSRPNHDWAPAKPIMFCHTNWSKMLICILHTLARLSVKSTQNLDSSVNRTGAQSFWVQVRWSRAHAKRICTWYRVNGTRIAGRLDLRPASCNRSLMVWVLMRTPVAFWKSLRNVVALSNRWRRAWTTRNRSWTSLVERSRPPACKCLTFPVVINRFHILDTTLWDTPRTLATCLWDNPEWSIPMLLFISSWLRWRLKRLSAILKWKSI